MERKVIVRCESAGVFFGILLEHDPATLTAKLEHARRLWYWAGAASLSQLAVDGTSKPEACKFPVAVPQITVAKVIEIIPTSTLAAESIEGVPIWRE